jgi:hypothetical protein
MQALFTSCAACSIPTFCATHIDDSYLLPLQVQLVTRLVQLEEIDASAVKDVYMCVCPVAVRGQQIVRQAQQGMTWRTGRCLTVVYAQGRPTRGFHLQSYGVMSAWCTVSFGPLPAVPCIVSVRSLLLGVSVPLNILARLESWWRG